MSGQREEEGAALLACVRSNATRDSLKLGLMPFEIARPGHRIWVPARECSVCGGLGQAGGAYVQTKKTASPVRNLARLAS